MTTVGNQISLRNAADQLGLHYMTVYRYVRIGKLAAVKERGQWFVDQDDLATLMIGSDPRTRDGTRRGSPVLLVARLIAGDEAGAWSIVEDALASGAEPREIHVRFLIPAMVSIGDRWELGELSVHDEHRATVVANRVTARLGPMFRKRGRSRGTLLIGLPIADPHGLTTAIVADLLRGEHFDVVDLGANTPAQSFVEAMRTIDRLLAVGISANIDANNGVVAETIAAIRRERPDVPLVIGGDAVADNPAALRLGADLYAPDAETTIELLESLRSA